MRFIVILFSLNLYMYAVTLGETLFEGNCVTCHRVDTDKSAPKIQKVIQAYKKIYPKREDFVENMAIWVLKPNAKTALMPKQIQKYEIMPELGYDKDTLRIIAEYLFEAYM